MTLGTYSECMIVSFDTMDIEKIWQGEQVKGLPITIQETASRTLRMINNSLNINNLMGLPEN